MDSFSKCMFDKINSEMSGMFKNIPKRLRIWSDIDKYNWREDESIWRQKREKESKDYELYFDGEFISSALASDGVNKGYLHFIEGIRNLYKEGKIFVHEEMYKVKEAEEEEKRKKEKELLIPKARNEHEDMMVKAIVKSAKKRGKKVKHV